MSTFSYPGAIQVAQTKTGLTDGVSYEFRLMLRNTGFFPTEYITYSGSSSTRKGV